MSEPRLFRPEKGNKYYIYEKDGGVNPARGNPMRRDRYLTSLPNCFHGDTKFITKDGLKTLRECVGKQVYVLAQDGEWREAEVKHFGQSELMKVTFPNNKVFYATPNHRWIVAKDKKNKDGHHIEMGVRTTAELSASCYNKMPVICRKKTDPVEYSVEGIQHGFIFGDGSYYNNHQYTRASLCGDKRTFMSPFFEDKSRCENANGTIECYPYPKEYKTLPSFEKDDAYLMGFLIGLMAADGCAGNGGDYRLATARLDVAEYLVDLLTRLKIRTNGFRKETRDKVLGGKLYADHTIYFVSIFTQCLSPEMVLNPKHRKLVEQAKGRENKYVVPKAIEKTDLVDDVYCVVEPVTHSFTLDGNILTGNCVAIYGWFNEIGGDGMKYLKAPWYPYSVITAAKREGLEVTEEPTLGGIMVWTGGKSVEGHVAGVGEIISDQKILTVESEYYGRDWATFYRSKGDGNWRDGCYWMGRTYVYKGCIKNPWIEDDMTKAETEKLIRELVPQILDEIKKETAKLPADDWAMEAINMCIAKGIMVGYPDGFHPQSDIRREEVAQVIANLTAKE